MRLLLALFALLLALAWVLHLYVLRTIPSESEPVPADLTRRIQLRDAQRMQAAMPPASRSARWRNRVRVCARQGHTYRVAFAPGYAHQCVACGHVRAIDTVSGPVGA
jgi:hypothetical protein